MPVRELPGVREVLVREVLAEVVAQHGGGGADHEWDPRAVAPEPLTALHPWSSASQLKSRWVGLGEPGYGAKDVLRLRLSRAEAAERQRRAVQHELRVRHEHRTADYGEVDARTPVVADPPSDKEREQHRVTHTPSAPWCEECVMGAGIAQAHRRLLFERHDTSKAKVYIDFA